MLRFIVISMICLYGIYSLAQEQQAPMDSLCPQTAAMAKQAVFRSPATKIYADYIVADKSRRLLHLLKDGVIFRSYKISLGGSPTGAKHQQGDNKTPEGLYYIDSKNSASDYTLALHVSYPNQDDINWARNHGVDPGGDIMVHGLPNEWWKRMFIHDGMDWTKGCVAVNHDDQINEIFASVKTGTPIELCR
jgi:murein L,D-transpeptidase YafK